MKHFQDKCVSALSLTHKHCSLLFIVQQAIVTAPVKGGRILPILKEASHQNKVKAIIKASRRSGPGSGKDYLRMYRMCSIQTHLFRSRLDERHGRNR